MSIRELIIDENGMRIVLILQPLDDGPSLGIGDFKARPAVPLKARGLREPAQAGDEASRGHGEAVITIVGPLDGDGQPIRDEEETAGRRRLVFHDTRHDR